MVLACMKNFVISLCPTPVMDDIGVVYNTRERFNQVRKLAGNVLKTKFVHHRHKDEEKGDEYEYTVNFCGEKENDTAVMQVDKNGKQYVIGKHDGSSVLIGAEDWLLLQYKNGKSYGHHCHKQKRQAWVSIRCEDGGETPQLKVIEEARFSHADKTIHPDRICYFLFEYNHPAACSPKKKGLSGGAVFCIIVLVLGGSYLLLGFVYQRFVAHATGLEQIPHYKFWRKFGNTAADGCDFICRTKEVSNSYKGITDDLDLESSDDDKDGLLPM